jgi:hypothetical protein
MSKGFMIHYMSTSPAGVNFDREWLESQSYEYVKFMYERCLKVEEMMLGNLEL